MFYLNRLFSRQWGRIQLISPELASELESDSADLTSDWHASPQAILRLRRSAGRAVLWNVIRHDAFCTWQRHTLDLCGGADRRAEAHLVRLCGQSHRVVQLTTAQVPEEHVEKEPAYVSRQYAGACLAMRLKHISTRPYTPSTNARARRFIQTQFREWAYGMSFWTRSNETTGFPDSYRFATI